MTPDREELRAWYRQALARRAHELRTLRERLGAGEVAAATEARAVGQALRGSGATFGFPELTATAALLETAPGPQVVRRAEGLVEHLNRLSTAAEAGTTVYAEWLSAAAGLSDEQDCFTDVRSAWSRASERSGLSPTRLAERAADYLGIGVARLETSGRAALRLVPEALMREELVLPVREDADALVVASADPTALSTELELMRLTGRELIFTVAAPETLRLALDALLDTRASQAARRRRLPSDEGAADTVLVVDDDSSSRLLARTVLEKRGYTVDEAGDGVQALDRLRSGGPVALVVADLNMPEMDGLELLWEIRADRALSHIPVIVLTGETDEVLETKLIEEGADDYVCKPLEPPLFLARVSATIRRAEHAADRFPGAAGNR